jgi:cell wall-associated NlpC family hydrolase
VRFVVWPLILVLMILLAGCSRHPEPARDTFDSLVEEIRSWLGTPYVYGAETRSQGADCSGFVRQAYHSVFPQIALGLSTEHQIDELWAKERGLDRPDDPSTWRFGDLIYIKSGSADPARRVNHVAMYLGDNLIVDSAIRRGVSIRRMPTGWLERIFMVYRPVDDFRDRVVSAEEIVRLFKVSVP